LSSAGWPIFEVGACQKPAPLRIRVTRCASAKMLDGLSIIRLDYRLEIVDTRLTEVAQVIDLF